MSPPAAWRQKQQQQRSRSQHPQQSPPAKPPSPHKKQAGTASATITHHGHHPIGGGPALYKPSSSASGAAPCTSMLASTPLSLPKHTPYKATVNKAETLSRDILARLEKLGAKHDKANGAIKAVHSQGSRFFLGSGGKLSQSTKTKMIALYDTAMKQSASEEATLRKLLADIQQLRRVKFELRVGATSRPMPRGALMVLLAKHAQSLPMWVGSVEGHPPPLVGAIPLAAGGAIEVGDFVAAYTEEIWILAEVTARQGNNQYEVKDIDDDAERPRMVLPRKYLISLPRYRANPHRDAHALFPTGALVLALYPQTTCFYKGVVERPPQSPTDDYQVAFEDSTYSTGYSPPLGIPQRYVVVHRDFSNAASNAAAKGSQKSAVAAKKRKKQRAILSDDEEE